MEQEVIDDSQCRGGMEEETHAINQWRMKIINLALNGMSPVWDITRGDIKISNFNH